ARSGSGSLGAEPTVLDQDHNDHLRPSGGRPRRVPGMIAPGRRLRRSGLAGDWDREVAEDSAGRPVRRMRRVVEGAAYHVDVGQTDTADRTETQSAHDGSVPREDRACNMRTDDVASVRERRIRSRELKRRHSEVALADGEVDGVALVPDPLGR